MATIQAKNIVASDAAELTDNAWSTAECGKFYRLGKVQKTMRIDADVLNWLESKGPGYQTHINNILREAMGSEEK